MHRAAAVLLLSVFALSAQSIQYSDSRKIWLLTTRQSSYAMGLGADGALCHLYWGGPRYYEPALKITRENGNRDLVLRYASHRINGNDLDIVLKDLNDAIEVTLHYRVYPDHGMLRRSATIRNATPRSLTVESAQSATWNLPPGEGYQLTYLTGRWAAETQVNHEPIHEGQKVLESRKGHTSHNFNPWFAIDSGDAGEEHGSVWFGALGWSGNWRMSIEQTPYRQVRVTGGLNT